MLPEPGGNGVGQLVELLVGHLLAQEATRRAEPVLTILKVALSTSYPRT